MKLKTNTEVYFHQALGIAQEFPPYNKLSKMELQVLGELMKHKHNGYKPLLNTEVRRLIEGSLQLTPAILRNNLSALRAKGLMISDEIPEKYMIKYLQPFNFEFYEET